MQKEKSVTSCEKSVVDCKNIPPHVRCNMNTEIHSEHLENE